MSIKDKKLFLMDMDGTLYLGDNLFESALDFLAKVKEIGGKYIFMTNNSSKGVDAYISKLKKFGIESCADDFLTSTDATIIHLKKMGYKKIYAFGTETFKKQLKDAGLSITDKREEGIDCLCIANDNEMTFKKFEDACILLLDDIHYVATNPDWVCPTSFGYVPDCGSFCEMLYRCSGKRPKFIGKPAPEMALLSMEKTGYTKEETIVIGDRIYTDIACGVNAGISQILVLSGETTMDDVKKSDIKPEYIYPSIKEVLREM